MKTNPAFALMTEETTKKSNQIGWRQDLNLGRPEYVFQCQPTALLRASGSAQGV